MKQVYSIIWLLSFIIGMRMTPACTDGMDPLTAYIEPDNLKLIDVGRGQSDGGVSNSAPGGILNFQTARPTPGTGLLAGFETAYYSVSRQQVNQGMAAYGGEQWGGCVFREPGAIRET